MAFGKKKTTNRKIQYFEKNIVRNENPFYPSAMESQLKEVLIAIGIMACCLALVVFIISRFSLVNTGSVYTNETGNTNFADTENSYDPAENREHENSGTEEALQSTFAYTDNDTVDLTACMNTEAYETITAQDGSYRFSYPKYIFNSSELDNGVYKFEHTSENGIDYQMKVYKESNSGDPVQNAQLLYRRYVSSFYSKYFELVSDSTDSQGMSRALLAGYLDSAETKGAYIIAANDGTDNYILEFYYPDQNKNDAYKDINYIVDCVYRYCSFSGTTYRPRTFLQFANDDMGEKK